MLVCSGRAVESVAAVGGSSSNVARVQVSQVAVRVSWTVLYCRPVVAGQRCADVWARFFRDETMRDEMPVGARIGSKHGR